MKKIKLGLFPKVVIAIVIGALLGLILPDVVIRIFKTFNVLFAQLLKFVVPLLVLGLVTPSIANLGRGAGKMLLTVMLIAYCSTVCGALFSYGVSSNILPLYLNPGELSAEAVAEKEIHTAGKPHHIELVADRQVINADGKDLSFITVKVVDNDGNLCPDAQHSIKYSVKGTGYYRAGANGDPVNLELFHKPQMKVFYGMMTAIVQNNGEEGKITLTASGKGLKSAKIVIDCK